MEGCDISTPSKKFKTLGKENRPPNTPSKSQVKHKVCATTEAEQLNFLKMLHETGSKSAVCTQVNKLGLPLPMSELFDKENLDHDFAALNKKCEDAFQRIEFDSEKV